MQTSDTLIRTKLCMFFIQPSLVSRTRLKERIAAGVQQASPEAVLTSLINDLDGADREMILVLDDYQFIHNQDSHEAVAFLLEHCPNTFHLVIATRSDPPHCL